MASVLVPAATAPDPAPLLLRYRRALDAVDELPIVYLIRRRTGRLNWLGRSLRTKLLLGFFVRWHVTARVAELRRASLAQAAVDRSDPSYAAVASQLEEFERSLPAVRVRRALLTSLVSVFVVAFLLASAAPNWDPTLSFLFKEDGGTARVGMRDASDPLEKMTGALLTLSPTSFGNAVKAFACKDGKPRGSGSECSAQRALVSSVTSAIVLCLAVWIVTLLPLTSFRLKRMLFNLDADDGVRELLRGQAAWKHFHAAEGIYLLEADLFHRLGRRRPSETPLDLACQACLMVLPIYAAALAATFAVYALRMEIRYGRYPGEATALAMIAMISVVFAAFASARLGTLRWAHGRRSAVGSAQDDGALPHATLRRRFVAHFADHCPFVVLGALLVLRAPVLATSEIGGLVAAFVLAPLALAVVQGASVARTGQTIGKTLLGLHVVRSDGSRAARRRTLVREALFKGVICGLPLLLLAILLRHQPLFSQYWWVAAPAWAVYLAAYGCATWNLRRSPLHDLVLDTVVVDTRRSAGT